MYITIGKNKIKNSEYNILTILYSDFFIDKLGPGPFFKVTN